MKVSRKTAGWIALGCFALALRLGVVVALWGDHAGPLAYEHGRIAENLLAGRGFTISYLGGEGPTSQQAPFYPFFLAALYAVFGVGSSDSLLVAQLLQCLAGTALVLAVVWLGKSLVPERPAIAWTAGLAAAVFPSHLYMVTHLQVVTWAALALTLLLGVVASPRWRGTWQGAVLAGVLSGALLLIEPILALALPICALAFWLGGSGKDEGSLWGRRPLGRVVLMAVVATAIIAPWTARNCLVHGEFVFIKSSFGYALWQGNNSASWGTDKIPKPSAEPMRVAHDGTLAGMNRALWEARHETLYIDDVLLTEADYARLAPLSEPERSRVLGSRAWEFIRRDPAAYRQLCLKRLRYFLLFDETNPKASNRLYRLATVAWLVIAGVGLLVSRSQWRRLWPTYAIFAAVTLFHTLVIVSARFRIPLEPMTFLWAAWAVAPMAERLFIPISHPAADPLPGIASDSGHALRGPHFSGRKSSASRRAGK